MHSQPVTNGQTVSFTLRDVICPDLVALFEHIGPELLVSGQVACLSDSGQEKDHFAIVDIEGIYTPLIVPVAQLRAWPLDSRHESDEPRPGEEAERLSKTFPCGAPAGDPNRRRDLP
ncbi:MAG: hypothetical protein JSV19_06145 [Phycisphaerales bacterium]|nr:MAG: hypothetical protein JSV19_06145 [Phycisphaerales bacterium]